MWPNAGERAAALQVLSGGAVDRPETAAAAGGAGRAALPVPVPWVGVAPGVGQRRAARPVDPGEARLWGQADVRPEVHGAGPVPPQVGVERSPLEPAGDGGRERARWV